MSDLDQIRKDITDLRESRGTLTANVANLTAQTAALAASVEKLTATLNQGRGALWAITAAAGTVGALVMAVIESLRH